MTAILEESGTATRYLISKQELADMLGYTTRNVDRLIAASMIPSDIIVRIPTGVKGNTKTRFIYTKALAWINSLSGAKMQTPEGN